MATPVPGRESDAPPRCEMSGGSFQEDRLAVGRRATLQRRRLTARAGRAAKVRLCAPGAGVQGAAHLRLPLPHGEPRSSREKQQENPYQGTTYECLTTAPRSAQVTKNEKTEALSQPRGA